MIRHGDKQREKILKAGLKMWRAGERVTLRAVADAVGLTHGTVGYHFKEDGLLDAIASYAVEIGDSRAIVQLIGQEHTVVMKMPWEWRRKHLEAVL